jgi:magnesium-protoporphyrin O-methyltransferase
MRKYRRSGPYGTTRRLLAALDETQAPKDTLLDVGGGIGMIAHEMLATGTSHAVIVDASPAFLAAAQDESERRLTEDRLRLQLGDAVALRDDVPAADVVTLDKVVCCYVDMESLIATAASRARRLMALAYPRDDWWVRALVACGNFALRVKGKRLSQLRASQRRNRGGTPPRRPRAAIAAARRLLDRRGVRAARDGVASRSLRPTCGGSLLVLGEPQRQQIDAEVCEENRENAEDYSRVESPAPRTAPLHPQLQKSNLWGRHPACIAAGTFPVLPPCSAGSASICCPDPVRTKRSPARRRAARRRSGARSRRRRRTGAARRARPRPR